MQKDEGRRLDERQEKQVKKQVVLRRGKSALKIVKKSTIFDTFLWLLSTRLLG